MTAENTPPEVPDGPVSDLPCYEAPRGGSTPADGPQWRDRGAIIATLTAEVEQLKDEVVRTNDRFAKARVRNGQLRTRAEAAERARDEALARESRLREAVEGLADEWAAEGIPCDCGHGLDTHNGLGCYERLSYKPLVTCECEQTDDRHDGQLAALILRALLAVQEPPTATEDTTTEQGRRTSGIYFESWCDDCEETITTTSADEVNAFNAEHGHEHPWRRRVTEWREADRA